MPRAFSRRPLAAEPRVRSKDSLCDIWLTKWHSDGFFSEYFGFFLSLSFHQCSILIFIHTLLLPHRPKGECLGNFKEAVLFWKSGSTGKKSTSITLDFKGLILYNISYRLLTKNVFLIHSPRTDSYPATVARRITSYSGS